MQKHQLRAFLTDENLQAHLSHLNDLHLKYSIAKKSIPMLLGKTPREIYAMNLRNDVREEILPLINGIICHKIYFSSFSSAPAPCKEIRQFYSSEAGFLYEVSELSRSVNYGFALIGRDRRQRPFISRYEDFSQKLPSGAVLALDLCEHAYFLDYRFSKDKYLKYALGFLDIKSIFDEKKRKNYLDTVI